MVGELCLGTAREAAAVQHGEGFALVGVEVLVGIGAPARLARVRDRVELRPEQPQGVRDGRHRDREDAAVRAARDVRDRAVVHVGGVLEARDGAKAAATPAVHIAVMWFRSVHLRREGTRHSRRGRAGLPHHLAGLTREIEPHVTLVRLERVRAERERELDPARGTLRGKRGVVASHATLDHVDVPPVVALGRREIEGEARDRLVEATVHVAVRYGFVTPLVDVDETRAESIVHRSSGISPRSVRVDCRPSKRLLASPRCSTSCSAVAMSSTERAPAGTRADVGIRDGRIVGDRPRPRTGDRG